MFLLKRYLQSQGLHELFPRTAAYLADPASFSLEYTSSPLDSKYGGDRGDTV